MGRSPLLGPWPEWVPQGSTPSLIPSERNDADFEVGDLLNIDYQSLPSPPAPAIFPMDVTIFNFSAVLENALEASRFRDHLRHQKYGPEGIESRRGYTPEHLRERWREKLREDEEDFLRSIYEPSETETEDSDRDPLEAPEDREKKRRSRLKWASPKTKAILDQMGIETIEVPSTPLPDCKVGEGQPATTILTEAQPYNAYPPAEPLQELDMAEWERTHPRLFRLINGEPEEPEGCNTDSNFEGFDTSNGIPNPDVVTPITKLGETSPNDKSCSPRNGASQQPSPPLSITSGSWIEEDSVRKAGKKRSHNELSESLSQDRPIHYKRRRFDAAASNPGIEAERSQTH